MTGRTKSSRSEMARLGFAELSESLERIAGLEARSGSVGRVPVTDAPALWEATADPDGALRLVERLIERAPDAVRPVLADEAARERLVRLLGASVGLGEFLHRRPAEIALLLDPITPPWSQDAYTASLVDAVDGATGEDARLRLRVRYRRHLAQIALFDVLNVSPTEAFPAVAAGLADLAGAGLAHRDHRERGRRDVGRRERDLAPGDVDRGVEGGARQVGEARRDGRERVRRHGVQHVEQGDLGQVSAVAHPQAHPGVLTRGTVDGLGQRRRVPLLRPRFADRFEQQCELGRTPVQELPETDRGAEQADQALGRGVVRQDGAELVRRALEQPLEHPQGAVRIGGATPERGRPGDRQRHVGAEPGLQVGSPLEALRQLREPQTGQLRT